MYYNKKRSARLEQLSGDNYKSKDFNPKFLDSSNLTEGLDKNLLIDVRGKEFYEKRRQNVEQKYKEWLGDIRYKSFKSKPIIPDSVIIEVFYYDQIDVTPSSIIVEDMSGNKISYYKVCPIAKVLASNTALLNPGDIVKLPAVISKTVRSEEWMQWKRDVTSQPSLANELPEPPALVGKLNEWVNYIYQEDILGDITIKDQHTFCLPYRMLLTIEP